MKKLLIFLVTGFMSYSCTAQQKLDLEKLTFKEDAKALTQTRKRSADRSEPLTTLPAYTTYDIAGYSFGPVALTEHCFVSFLLNSVEEKKFVGLLIGYETTAQSKAINKYVLLKYGKPVTLESEKQLKDKNNKPYPSGSAYLWRNVRPGVSILLSNSYVFENNVAVENTNLLIIENDAKPSFGTDFKTALDRAIKTNTP